MVQSISGTVGICQRMQCSHVMLLNISSRHIRRYTADPLVCLYVHLHVYMHVYLLEMRVYVLAGQNCSCSLLLSGVHGLLLLV